MIRVIHGMKSRSIRFSRLILWECTLAEGVGGFLYFGVGGLFLEGDTVGKGETAVLVSYGH